MKTRTEGEEISRSRFDVRWPGDAVDDLGFAHALADLASAITLSREARSAEIRYKGDATPVTDVDLEVERALRAATAVRFPQDGFLGEEEGRSGHGERVWVVDPIDGTRSFVGGIQLWATLIALEIDGLAVVAVVDAPRLGERYEAVKGRGARLNGRPIRVSDVGQISDAFVLHSGVEEWLRGTRWKAFIELIGTSFRSRGLSDFWGHMLVARGSADVSLEHEPCGVWDWAALRLVVEEAGGRMTTLDGDEPSHLCSLISSNGTLHGRVLAQLDGRSTGSSGERTTLARSDGPDPGR